MKRQPKPKAEKAPKVTKINESEEHTEGMNNNYFCPHCIESIRAGNYVFGTCKFMKDYRSSVAGV